MTTVVVTGGAGFIGSHLVTKLIEQNYHVRVLDNLSTGKRSNLSHIKRDVEFEHGSVADLETCKKICRGATYVWHLGALGSVPRSLEMPLISHNANATGSLAVLWAALQEGVKRVVFSSSSSVYGKDAKLPQQVTDMPAPASPYAVTKLAGEHYMRVFSDVFGLETVTLRYFNVFGPRQNPDGPYAAVIPAFFTSILNGKAGRIEGDGEQSRDFTYVSDCVQATVKAMSAPAAAGKTYNVACNRSTTINELYRLVAELTNCDLPAIHLPPREGDVPKSLADISATVADLGYEPEYTMRAGLEETVPYYMEAFRNGALKQ